MALCQRLTEMLALAAFLFVVFVLLPLIMR